MTSAVHYDQQLAQAGTVVISQARRRIVVAILGAVAFVAAGLWLISIGQVVIGWLSIGFFGILGIPALIVQMWRPRRVTVTRSDIGIGDLPPVPWSETVGIGVFERRGTRIGMVELTDEGKTRIGASGAGIRALQRMNDQIVGRPTLSLPAGLDADFDELLDWLVTVRGRSLMM